MSVDVKKYVQGCNTCQQNKPSNEVPFGLLQLNKVPGAPWDIVMVDLITQLPLSINDNGNTWDTIMVVVDRLTKRAHFFPCGSNITAIQVATVFYEHIFPLHRLPCQIISNQGTQFVSQVFKEFCKKLGIKSSMSTAYHPQTNRQTE
jgi:hypothetical protein